MKEAIVTLVLGILIGSALVWGGKFMKEKGDEEALCLLKGGVMVGSMHGYICVKTEVIELEK